MTVNNSSPESPLAPIWKVMYGGPMTTTHREIDRDIDLNLYRLLANVGYRLIDPQFDLTDLAWANDLIESTRREILATVDAHEYGGSRWE